MTSPLAVPTRVHPDGGAVTPFTTWSLRSVQRLRPIGGCVARHGALQWPFLVDLGGEAAMARRVPSTAGPPEPMGRLPVAASPLIGRDVELAELRRVLLAADSRLTTLTGPPGVGKTRLARAAATAVAGSFVDGVVFVDLAPVRDPEQAMAEVARALGVRTVPGSPLAGRVTNALVDKDLLLLLDNCEQIVAAGPDLAAPLRASPGLRLLVTSRERLYVGAEREVPVPPLTLPGRDDAADPARLAEVPAAAMLVARVRAATPDFTVTAGNAEAVAEICRRLDGLPLALELAAARVKLFTPAELAARLGHRLGLLTTNARDAPARHRTLRAALEWSHDLLNPAERALFRRLSVFVGDWTLNDASRVCGGTDAHIVETVGSLVDKSLVRRTPRADLAEFVLLESLREYAAELLAEHDDHDAVRARHAAYFTELATAHEGRIAMAGEHEWWRGHSASDHANLRAAFEHLLAAGQPSAALRIAAALGWHAFFRGHLGSGFAQVMRALDAAAADPRPPPRDALAAALVSGGILAWSLDDPGRARELLTRAVEISDATGDLRRTGIASSFLGHVARTAGDHDEARARHERAAELYRQLPSATGYAWTRYDLGLLARRQGDLDAAQRLLRRGLALFREIDYGWAIGHCAWALAAVCLRRADGDESAALLAEALARFDAAGDGRGLAQCMEVAAAIACARGQADVAARLLGAAAGRRQRLAAPLPAEDREAHDAVEDAVRRALGVEGADRSHRAGRDMTGAAGVDLARTVTERAAASLGPPGAAEVRGGRAQRPPGRLTPREQQVAQLVACGRTNRQIGRELGISEKTVEAHVHHVIAKLDARSRTEVAAWVLTRPSP